MSGLNPQTHKSKTLLCGLVIVDPFHIQSPKGFAVTNFSDFHLARAL